MNISNKQKIVTTYKIKEITLAVFITNREILLKIGLLLPVYLRGDVDVIRNAFCVRAKWWRWASRTPVKYYVLM
jgi:hypothetical protein